MHLRSTLAMGTGALLLAVPTLSSCGFNYATDRDYQPAAGANQQDAPVDVLSAVVVSQTNGAGTFVASFANSTEQDQTVTAVGSATSATIQSAAFEPITVPRHGLVNLAEEGGISLTGEDISVGGYVDLEITFGSGEAVQVAVPVVVDDGIYDGLDGPAPLQPADDEGASGQ